MTESTKMNVDELEVEIWQLQQTVYDAREKIRNCEDKLDRITAAEDQVRIILLVLLFLALTVIPWKTIEEQKRKEAEGKSVVKYIHVTEEEMPGFLKAVEKLGGEVVDVKPVRTVEGTNSTKNEHRVKNVWATEGGVFDVKDVYTGVGKSHDTRR